MMPPAKIGPPKGLIMNKQPKCWCGKEFLHNIQDHGYVGKCPDGHMTVVQSFMDASNTFVLSEMKARYEKDCTDVGPQRAQEAQDNPSRPVL